MSALNSKVDDLSMRENVFPLIKNAVLPESEPHKLALWKRLLLVLGFMKHENEPGFNGTSLFFAMTTLLAVMLFFFKSTILFAFFMDKEMQTEAMQNSAERNIENKLNRSEEKRAKIIDFLGKGGKPEDIPLEWKIFEAREADTKVLNTNKESKP